MKRVILFVALAALCGAQTTVNGGRDFKGTLKASGSISAVDFSGAASTAPAKAGLLAARPTACTCPRASVVQNPNRPDAAAAMPEWEPSSQIGASPNPVALFFWMMR